MSEQQPPHDELRDLFEAERAAPTIDSSSRAAWRSRLAAATGGTPLGHAAAGTALGGLGKALAIVAVTVAAGTGTIAIVKYRTADTSAAAIEPPVPMAAKSPPVIAKPPVEPVAPKLATPPAPPQSPHVAARAPIAKAPVPPVVASDPVPSPPSETELLRAAWSALAAGNAERALEIVSRDAQLHPDGVLDEEREVVEVVALAKLQRGSEAKVAAARFLERHPNSVHRALVERSTNGETAQ